MGLPDPKETEGTDLSACITGEADTEEGALMMCTGPAVIFGDGNEWRAYREIAEELKSMMYVKMNEIGDSFENVI